MSKGNLQFIDQTHHDHITLTTIEDPTDSNKPDVFVIKKGYDYSPTMKALMTINPCDGISTFQSNVTVSGILRTSLITPLIGANQVNAPTLSGDIQNQSLVSSTGNAGNLPDATGYAFDVSMTSIKEDKSVVGVYQNSNLAITSGYASVWAVNTGGDIDAGDYLTSSWIPGFAAKQAGDTMRNQTLGKSLADQEFRSQNRGVLSSFTSNNASQPATRQVKIYSNGYGVYSDEATTDEIFRRDFEFSPIYTSKVGDVQHAVLVKVNL